jgi:hypothetical protein
MYDKSRTLEKLFRIDMMMMMIQFLFINCKLNSPEIKYKVSRSTQEEPKNLQSTKYGSVAYLLGKAPVNSGFRIW